MLVLHAPPCGIICRDNACGASILNVVHMIHAVLGKVVFSAAVIGKSLSFICIILYSRFPVVPSLLHNEHNNNSSDIY
jgi:hypothetical protein